MLRNSIHRTLVVTVIVSCTAILRVPSSRADTYPATTATDNTKMNQGDQNAGAVTADHAKQNISDRDLMSQIRQSVVKDHALSTYAHNVKIVAQNGTVTLKGPVKTAEEKQTVLNKAIAVAGAENVHDQMTVKENSN